VKNNILKIASYDNGDCTYEATSFNEKDNCTKELAAHKENLSVMVASDSK
jgi:hypothetical protein